MKMVLGKMLLATGVLLCGFAASAEGTCETDFNRDGVTNDADFEILKSYMGATEEDPRFDAAADLDEDGTISLVDLNLFLSCKQ